MIHIISTGAQCERYIDRYAQSVLKQDYQDYMIHIIDDMSTDKTGIVIDNYFKNTKHNIIHASTKLYGNQAQRILMTNPIIKDDDIVCVVDLDDWLPDNNVLKRLESYYSGDILFTFGDYIVYGENKSSINAMPDIEKLRSNARFTTSHLKSWKHKLYKGIRDEDFKDKNGCYYITAQDYIYCIPMLEMAGENRVFFSKDINYVYNRETPYNDDKTSNMQVVVASEIRKKER